VDIKVQDVKRLREETGAGVLDCHKALKKYQGDFEQAAEYLKEKGLAAAAKREDREATEGIVETYSHPGNRVGVMVEVNCETDFVARTPQFQEFVHDLALHVAAMSPTYLSVEDIPQDVLDAEKAAYRQGALDEGKPERIVERIVEGRLVKFYESVCLMEQPFVKDDEIKIKDLYDELKAELKENIIVRRFVRYELGEQSE
jgi:elongation factor Ts